MVKFYLKVNKVAKAIFTELENDIYKDHPIKTKIQIIEEDITTLNFSEFILSMFKFVINLS